MKIVYNITSRVKKEGLKEVLKGSTGRSKKVTQRVERKSSKTVCDIPQASIRISAL